MTARVISVANLKGGVSKTSTGLFLATALAKNKGRKVLYLDCDSQDSAYDYRQFEKKQVYGEDEPEPYRIRKTDQENLIDDIREYQNSYDIIFIDLPRLTRSEDDKTIGMILTLCDSVLIPVTAGELVHMSTAKFVKIIKRIAKRKEGKYTYKCALFASMVKKQATAENQDTTNFMESLGLPHIKTPLYELVRFKRPYTYESLLDIGKGEKERFEPFFNEVVEFFNL